MPQLFAEFFSGDGILDAETSIHCSASQRSWNFIPHQETSNHSRYKTVKQLWQHFLKYMDSNRPRQSPFLQYYWGRRYINRFDETNISDILRSWIKGDKLKIQNISANLESFQMFILSIWGVVCQEVCWKYSVTNWFNLINSCQHTVKLSHS